MWIFLAPSIFLGYQQLLLYLVVVFCFMLEEQTWSFECFNDGFFSLGELTEFSDFKGISN